MASVVRDHAKAEAVVVKAVENQTHAVLFELAVVFPAVRVRHLDFARLQVRAGAKAPRREAKTLRPEEKLPEGDPKTVLSCVPAVVKRATQPPIVRFQAMTGNDKEKT